MTMQQGKIVSGGRVQLPAEARRALGLVDGDHVVMQVVDGAIVLKPYKTVVAEVQARLRAVITPGPSLVDELIAERRAEAARE